MPPPTTDTPRRLALLLTAGGGIGLLAAAVLLIEKIRLLEDPDYVPSCSINPILSCGSIMTTPQAEVFGFPNPILGIAGFAAILTTGVALLAGATLRRWYWLTLQAGVTIGVVFVHWLIFQSLYRIGALCPYCMVVWIVTIPIFFYVTIHNTTPDTPAKPGPLTAIARWVSDYHGVIINAWYLIIATLIGHRFWDYWETLLP